MIQFEDVTKKYGADEAVNNVTLHLEKGKIYGLLGPNGSGKSTLLKMIAGLAFPTDGKVMVNGKKVDRTIAKDVAFLSELDFYYPPFTVGDAIKFANSQFPDFDIEKADQLVQFMELEKGKKIRKLSKGNRGRLKLVLVLARNAPILLLDEPFSGLDPLVRDSIVKGLLSYIDFDNQTVIIATHEIDEIEPILDEVLLIKNGKIYGQVNVEELRDKEGLSVKEWMKQILVETR